MNICNDHVFLSWTEINFRVIFLLLLLDHITVFFSILLYMVEFSLDWSYKIVNDNDRIMYFV